MQMQSVKHCISSFGNVDCNVDDLYSTFMGTRQLKQQAYAQLSQALAKLKIKVMFEL
jgi:hypothetical protein